VADGVVCRLAIAPVKGTRLRAVERIELGRAGVRENRRFYLIDARDRMVNAKTIGALQTVIADYSDAERRLTLTFPDGHELAGEVALDGEVQTQFFSRSTAARLVEGPWSAALSEYIGRPLRLVEPVEGAATDRGKVGVASLISRASLDRLASEAGRERLDPRRFRMLIEIDGVNAHEEDQWVGRRARVGQALIAWGGHVGRCLITSRDPDTGEIDVPTLDLLGSYRSGRGTTEPLPFGIYGTVLEPGTVAVGDEVSLEG
jgi:MOSC domain-containing protein